VPRAINDDTAPATRWMLLLMPFSSTPHGRFTRAPFQFFFVRIWLAAGVIRHQAQVKLQENDAVLRQQDDRLAGWAAENHRLSKSLRQRKAFLLLCFLWFFVANCFFWV
jgi:hypothetical protein